MVHYYITPSTYNIKDWTLKQYAYCCVKLLSFYVSLLHNLQKKLEKNVCNLN